MFIKYLNNCNNSIFEVIGRKIDNNIVCTALLINPLCRFISNKEDLDALNTHIDEYRELLADINIEFKNEDILNGQDYFLFGVLDNGDNNISFAYSELFNVEDFQLAELQKKSIEMSRILNSTINKNQKDIESNLECKITEMLSYNYSPLEDGVAEVFGVVLIPEENSEIPSFTVKYYLDPNNQNPNAGELITNMFDTLVPEIAMDLKVYNFFMLTEPTTVIKLGISTTGEYVIDTNNILINDLSENKLNTVKEILVKTYEQL